MRERRWTVLPMLVLVASATAAAAETARVVVFEDLDRDGVRDPNEPPVPGVVVSNGREVARTGEDGSYRLEVEDGSVLFVVKPSGWAVPVNGRNLPRFFHVHRPQGTPKSLGLRYRGLDPTGPLPDAVDFPLTRSAEPDTFRVVWFADPQPQTSVEVDYIRDDVVAELVGIDAAFGITAGDIQFDDLSLFPRYNDIVARIGIPWYNVPGNHDLNLLAPDDRRSLETFKRHFGPSYYSFDYGRAHFVVLDDVEYLGRGRGRAEPHPREAGAYVGRIDEVQLEWLANDLREVPDDRLVVVVMHIPFRSYHWPDRPERNVANRADVFRILSGRSHVVAVAGHMHTQEHHYFGEEDGFTGSEPLHQHVLATVSGSWWSGPMDERGIPVSVQRDGTPNGYYFMTVEGNRYRFEFRAAGEPSAHQMRISIDADFYRYQTNGMRDFRPGQLLRGPITVDQVHAAEVLVNLFDGGPRSSVTLRVDDRSAVPMERTSRHDPFVVELFARNAETKKSWVGPEPSSHLWVVGLPIDLEPGVHTLTAVAVDEYGKRHETSAVLEVLATRVHE